MLLMKEKIFAEKKKKTYSLNSGITLKNSDICVYIYIYIC